MDERVVPTGLRLTGWMRGQASSLAARAGLGFVNHFLSNINSDSSHLPNLTADDWDNESKTTSHFPFPSQFHQFLRETNCAGQIHPPAPIAVDELHTRASYTIPKVAIDYYLSATRISFVRIILHVAVCNITRL